MLTGPEQWVKGSGIAAAMAWVAVVAQIQAMTHKLLYAVGAPIKLKKKKNWSWWEYLHHRNLQILHMRALHPPLQGQVSNTH